MTSKTITLSLSLFVVGFVLGGAWGMRLYQNECISRGFARYDLDTNRFVWRKTETNYMTDGKTYVVDEWSLQ